MEGKAQNIKWCFLIPPWISLKLLPGSHCDDILILTQWSFFPLDFIWFFPSWFYMVHSVLLLPPLPALHSHSMKVLCRHQPAYTFSSSCCQKTTYTQTASGLTYTPTRYRQPVTGSAVLPAWPEGQWVYTTLTWWLTFCLELPTCLPRTNKARYPRSTRGSLGTRRKEQKRHRMIAHENTGVGSAQEERDTSRGAPQEAGI